MKAIFWSEKSHQLIFALLSICQMKCNFALAYKYLSWCVDLLTKKNEIQMTALPSIHIYNCYSLSLLCHSLPDYRIPA